MYLSGFHAVRKTIVRAQRGCAISDPWHERGLLSSVVETLSCAGGFRPWGPASCGIASQLCAWTLPCSICLLRQGSFCSDLVAQWLQVVALSVQALSQIRMGTAHRQALLIRTLHASPKEPAQHLFSSIWRAEKHCSLHIGLGPFEESPLWITEKENLEDFCPKMRHWPGRWA